jgi:hypothetical protein
VNFSNDPELEALVGRVCLTFARVEQEVGHVVMAAHGDWDVAMSTDYLDFSSSSGLLFKWLKNIGKAYPEVKDDTKSLAENLAALKAQRDEWAHSAQIVDLWLMMAEQGRSSMSDRDVEWGKLLNAKKRGHTDAPSKANVDDFTARASDAGDAASVLATTLAVLIDDVGVREVRDPRKKANPSVET